ncbi:MAG TPA: hypothetical protein VKA49_10055 [Flavitalea sp.]|nr:hypothetical protein [Flavitalea sp.]
MNTNASPGDFFSFGIDAHSRELLKNSAIWAKIIAVVGFISAGVSVLTTVINKLAVNANIFAAIGPITGSLIIAAITVSLNLFLLRFASNISDSLSNMNQQQFNSGASNLRIYFKFIGILVIIFLSLFLLAMLFFIMGTGLSG